MNKILNIFLTIMIIPHFSLAQEKEDITNTYNDKIRNIHYSIFITKENKTVLKTDFVIKNEDSLILLNTDSVSEEQKLDKKDISLLSGKVAGNVEGADYKNANSSQLSLIVHLDKNGKNLWSDFSLSSIDANTNEKLAYINENKNKAIASQEQPIEKQEEKKLTVVHQNNKETQFSWQGSQYIIKAKL